MNWEANPGRSGANITGKERSLPIAGLFRDLRLAARNLLRNRQRTLVAVGTVAFGIVAFLLAGGFIEFIFHDMRETTIHSQLGHIQIVRPGYFDKGIADPYAFLLPGQSSEQQVVEKTPGFAGLAPRLAFSGLISHDEATIAFIGEGVDPEREQGLSSSLTFVEGRNLASASEHAAILGEGLARSLGVRPGDRIVLLATAATGSASAVEVTVVGAFATTSQEYDDRALRIPIAVARKLMKVSGATAWIILLNTTDHTAAAAGHLASALDGRAFEVVPWTALADFYNKTVVLFSKQVSVVKYIIGLLIVLTISNTQMMCVLERTTEIGTSLAIGRRGHDVMMLFLAEGALVGLLGGFLGVLLGYTLASLISAIGIPMPPPPGMAHGFIGQILVGPRLAIDAFVLAVLTTLVASVMPAWKASRMSIVDALRHNQ